MVKRRNGLLVWERIIKSECKAIADITAGYKTIIDKTGRNTYSEEFIIISFSITNINLRQWLRLHSGIRQNLSLH